MNYLFAYQLFERSDEWNENKWKAKEKSVLKNDTPLIKYTDPQIPLHNSYLSYESLSFLPYPFPTPTPFPDT